MKSLNIYINEKLILNKYSKSSSIEDDLVGKIINILKKQNIKIIDKYNNNNLINDLYYDDNNIIDIIQFNNNYKEVTLFYISTDGNDNEDDKTFDITYWFDYFTEEDTERILDNLINLYK